MSSSCFFFNMQCFVTKKINSISLFFIFGSPVNLILFFYFFF